MDLKNVFLGFSLKQLTPPTIHQIPSKRGQVYFGSTLNFYEDAEMFSAFEVGRKRCDGQPIHFEY